MKTFQADKIRNICLIAHSKAGKTSMAETMLFNSGAISRIGKTADGNTVCDYDSQEVKRELSIRASLAALEWNGNKLNLLDTPGYFDFIGDMHACISASDAAVLVISGKSGPRVGGLLAFKHAVTQELPILFFINKMDHENAKFDDVLAELQSSFGANVLPFEIPIKDGTAFTGYVDVIHEKAYQFDGKNKKEIPLDASYQSTIADIKATMNEVIAETNETLMEKFFADEPFTNAEFISGIKEAIATRNLFPVFCGSAAANLNMDTFAENLIEYAPSPVGAPHQAALNNELVPLECDDNAPLAAQVFKTIVDPFIGKLSLFRVFSGKIAANSTVFNATQGAAEKIGPLFSLQGKEKLDVPSVGAGDIGAVAKLGNTKTGDTLCSQAKQFLLPPIAFPQPVYSMAVIPLTRGDEEKISSGLHKLTAEDQTLAYRNDAEAHQLIVSGLGDQHLEVVLARLKDMGTEVRLEEPKVLYRETFTKKIQAEGKHKKQSGGHGQYGHVKIEFEPCDSEELVFEEKIFGGSVPKNYHPAVEKGLQEMMDGGIQAGYRVVGVKATLYDGSYHDVDSSEMAFKMAAHLAFKELVKAGPVLLEPIGHLEVNVSDQYTGDVMGDINKRRGRVIGMEPGKIVAEVPMSEMAKYAIDLRSITQGRGDFTFTFERYEQAPPMVTQKIIEAYQQSKN